MNIMITNDNMSELLSSHPEIIDILHKQMIYRIIGGLASSLASLFFIFHITFIGISCITAACILFYSAYEYHIVYNEACRVYWKNKYGNTNNNAAVQANTTLYQSTPKKNETHYDKYNQIYRQGASDNNLNYACYKFSAKYTETNRMRTNRSIYIFGNEDVRSAIRCLGYEEPITYELLKPTPATERQIAYLKDLTNVLPQNLSIEDASALISKITSYDRIPNPQLFEYASEMRIGISYYAGKKQLYGTIFNQLKDPDRTAFFIFCVYRYLSEDHSTANLNRSSYRNKFFEFAEQVRNDASFQKSMDGYEGAKLRFFGTRTVNGRTAEGGSKNTIAYKKARQFLSDNALIHH